ncbi:hypothetical protein ACWEQG_01915 [Microbispora sp. NPDC004025]
MAYKTFTGAFVTASEIDVYLAQQAVIVCTSTTRPPLPPAGMRIWQTDTLTEHFWDGTTWQFLSGLNRFVRKTADESVANSTAVQADDHLFVSVAANAVYAVEAFIICSSPTTADMKLNWAAPAGSTMDWSSLSPHTAQTNRDQSTISVAQLGAGGQADAAGYGDNIDVIFMPRGRLTTVSSGTLQFRWAQSTANATAAKVKTNSYLYAKRIA